MDVATCYRRATRCLAAVLSLVIPACVALTEQTTPPQHVGRPVGRMEPDTSALSRSSEAKADFALPNVPKAGEHGTPLPITLPAALALTNAEPLDVQIADERVRSATAQHERAEVLWLPNLNVGFDYFRHDGQIQDIVGNVFTTSRSSVLLGAGPQAVVATADAVYAPLVTRQVVTAAAANAQVSRNDTTLAVAVAYFNVQQARGEVAGAVESLRYAEDLVARAEKLAPDYAPEVEINRARAEAARRRQGVEAAYERWQVASADLTRLLRLQPDTIVEPAEQPSLLVCLIDPATAVAELVAVGLTHRPELAAHQALVQAALARARQEKVRPLYPTIAVRGVGSNTPGLAGGYFGGGVNDDLTNFGARFSVDIQAIWEVQNLGLGNRALAREREADSRRALLELLRAKDFVASEVVQAHAQLARANRRLAAAHDGVANAATTVEKNLKGLEQTKRIGEQLVLVFRPQEVVAAVSALDQAYRDYFQAVADHNRAQYRLYRAIGQPAAAICQAKQLTPGRPVTMSAADPVVAPTTTLTELPTPRVAPLPDPPKATPASRAH